MVESRDGVRQQPVPPRWNGIQSLDLVHELNVRCIELLAQEATTNVDLGLPFVAKNILLWKNLTDESQRRLATLPFLLMNVHFQNEAWWRIAITGDSSKDLIRTIGEVLPDHVSKQLMHEVSLFAWQTARWDKTVARMSLGMAPAVCDLLASLTPRQILAIASREFRAISVRWAGDSVFWGEMIDAATVADTVRLADLRLHAGLRMCSEMLR